MCYWALVLGLLTAVVAGCGCGDGRERVVLSGGVTYQGEPVVEGSILFAPCDGTVGPSRAAKIAAGHYRPTASEAVRLATIGSRFLPIAKAATAENSSGRHRGTCLTMTRNNIFIYFPEKYNVNLRLK